MDKKTNSGLNIRNVAIFLIVVNIFLFIVSITCAFITSNRYNQIEHATNDYIMAQQNISSLKTTSDFLTDRVRQYVITGNEIFANEYFHEIEVSKTREHAVENISQAMSVVGLSTVVNITDALNQSNALLKKEIEAIGLIASVNNHNKILDKCYLNSYVMNLTEEEKRQLAFNSVFDSIYSAEKDNISIKVSSATDELLAELYLYKIDCSNDYNISSNWLKFILVLAFFTFSSLVFFMFSYVLKPLKISIKAIQEEKLIPHSKSYEINYLARTYNIAYERNVFRTNQLKKIAEHDALTGLLNRAYFEKIKEKYSKREDKLALLMIDVDYFKSINDTYGHEMGDRALKKVAELLNACFLMTDFSFRYGGDEFIVLMTGITKAQEAVIAKKLIYLNDCFQKKDEDGLPEFSVSIGGAFSEKGFTEDLLARADNALYLTKQRGRAGFTFD